LGVVAVACILGLGIIGLGIAAVQAGLVEREYNRRQAAMIHYERGVALLANGYWELARTEFETALQLAPGLSAARHQIDQLEILQNPPVGPTPIPTTPRAEDFFSSARAAYESTEWDLAIGQLQQLRQLDPQFRTGEVEDMLFWAAVNRGLELVNQNQVAEAIGYFDRALSVKPGNVHALGHKQMGLLYLEALKTESADPDRAIAAWQSLYQLNKNYHDVAVRLSKAYLNQGDSLVAGGDWCAAQTAYEQATAIRASTEADLKAQTARNHCLATPVVQRTPALTRAYTAQLTSMTDIGGSRIQVRGRVLDVQGRPKSGVGVRISAYNWSAMATTDGHGEFSFDGLKTPARYTLTLLDLPAVPFEVQMDAGKQAIITFTGQK